MTRRSQTLMGSGDREGRFLEPLEPRLLLAADLTAVSEVLQAGISRVGNVVQATTLTCANGQAIANDGGDSAGPSAIVADAPDLTVAIELPYIYPMPVVEPGGEVAMFDFVVQNLGSASSPPCDIGFYLSTNQTITINDIYLTEGLLDQEIHPGEEWACNGLDLTIPWDTAPGEYYLGVLLDFYEGIDESDESNNADCFPIKVVASQPNLVLPKTVRLVIPRGGKRATATFTIANAGVAPLETTMGLPSKPFLIDPVPPQVQGNVVLPAGGEAHYTVKLRARRAVKRKTFGTIRFDSGAAMRTIALVGINRNVQGARARHAVSAASTLADEQPLPDLIVAARGLVATPTSVAAGGQIQLADWTVSNPGEGSTPAVWIFNTYLLSSDPVIDATDTFLGNSPAIPGQVLTAGATYDGLGDTVTIPQAIAPGTYYLGMLVDSANWISESNETNNYVAQQITVQGVPAGKPDLATVGKLGATPANVAHGGTVSVPSVTVTNLGDVVVPIYRVRIYLSNDPIITAADTWLVDNLAGPMSPGQQVCLSFPTIPIPAATPTGNYYLGLLLDTDSQIEELDETNNYVAQPLYVGTMTVPPKMRLLVKRGRKVAKGLLVVQSLAATDMPLSVSQPVRPFRLAPSQHGMQVPAGGIYPIKLRFRPGPDSPRRITRTITIKCPNSSHTVKLVGINSNA